MIDPPRVTGAYGVPAYDPDFGLGSRGANVEPKASIPPPPPRDPYVQLLGSQSAMSMFMMQMAREMNQRSQLQQPQQQQQGVPNPTPQPSPAAGQPIGQAGPAREMRMDTGNAGATMEAVAYERKRTLRVQGLVGKIQRLVVSYPRCLRTRVG